jgi:hypothetical protein
MNDIKSFQKQFAKHAKFSYNGRDERFAEYGGNLLESSRDYMVVRDLPWTVFAIRGTKYKDDLIADLYVSLDQLKKSKRFIEIENEFKKWLGVPNIILTGHSLGGRIAYELGIKYGVPSVTFNMFTFGLFDDLMSEGGAGSKGKNNLFFWSYDPLSFMSLFMRNQVVKVKPKSLDMHTINNFL